MSPNPTAMHQDCVACRASADGVTGDDQTIILLGMIASGDQTAASIVLELCGVHRNRVRDLSAHMREREIV